MIKLDLPFFKCNIYDGGAWFRFGILGGFSISDRQKNPWIPQSFRASRNIVKIGKYTLHRLQTKGG